VGDIMLRTSNSWTFRNSIIGIPPKPSRRIDSLIPATKASFHIRLGCVAAPATQARAVTK
jgi:hypothetical protein